MGGSLIDVLKCGNDQDIKTPYSERVFSTTNMQYVELTSNYDSSSADYSKVWFFTPTEDFGKIKDIIITGDNKVHQCRSNDRACLDTDTSFTKLIDMYYQEVHYDTAKHRITSTHEGFKSKGLEEGIMRHMDWESAALEWYNGGKLNGKQFLKWINRDFCYKGIYKDDELIKKDFDGQDMTTP